MNSFYFCNLCKFVFISIVFIWTSGVSGLRCTCDWHCPDDHENFTCVTSYRCFKTQEFTEGTKEIKETHGCMGNKEGEGMFQCRSTSTKFFTPLRVQCCDDHDFCNKDLTPTIPKQEISIYHSRLERESKVTRTNHAQGLALAISISVCATLLFIIIAYIGFRYLQIKAKNESRESRRLIIPNGTAPVGSIGELILSGQSSGSGAGAPALGKRTIAREIELFEEIGRGRFAIVYKGRWREQVIAAKCVHTYDEVSWRNELEMYGTGRLINENILGFIAGDIWEPFPGQELQRLVITVFHEFGSLHDFLQCHSYDSSVLFRLAYTAVSGLVHIHRTVPGSRSKAAMAHRDITSRNILVQKNLQCCIGDFGLAVKANSDNPDQLDIKENPRLPTYRYMPPEILENFNCAQTSTLKAYQQMDMWAFSLVLWEMVLRYEVQGAAEDYILPFSEYLKNEEEPSYSEMQRIVLEEHRRCILPPKYHNDQHSKIMIRLIEDCSNDAPMSRLTALRARMRLEQYLQDKEKSDGEQSSGGSSIATASTGLS